MTKQQVLERFCNLAKKTMEKHFRYAKAADCFCGDNPNGMVNFQFDEEVMEFIEKAVDKALTANPPYQGG